MIAARNRATGTERATVTDAGGRYQIAALPVGDYRLEVKATGFQTQILENLQVEITRIQTLDFQLQVGDISRVDDLYIVSAFRGKNIDRALVAHILQLARRLLPKIIVASPAAQNVDEIAFLESCGFVTAGTLREFRRPT